MAIMFSRFPAITAKISTPLTLALAVSAAVLLGGCVSESSSSSGGSGDGNPVSSQPSNNIGQVNLSWVEPTLRENGDPLVLSDISGYEVHYGTTSGDYTEVLEVAYPDTSVSINSLGAGRWYFAVRTVDTEQRRSRFSEEKSVWIN